MAITIMYHTEQQTNNRWTVYIMAAILKVVIRGEGSGRGNENGAYLSFSQMKRYLFLLLDTDLLTTEQEKESIYKLTLKATRFSQLYEQLYKMIQYPRK